MSANARENCLSYQTAEVAVLDINEAKNTPIPWINTQFKSLLAISFVALGGEEDVALDVILR